ncbi:MAG: hypothetical protein ACYC1Q_04450 [Bacteroidia bacterium]
MLAFFIILLPIIIGVTWFFILRDQMRKEEIPNPPESAYFLIFLCYGSLFLFTLISIFGSYSPLILIGILFIAVIAPILMYTVRKDLENANDESKYHKTALLLSTSYFLFLLGGLFISFVFLWN